MAYRSTGANASGSNTSRRAKPPRRGDIQGLRAIAVIAVVLFHADAGLPGGFVGVDMFFVISGYVITRLVLWEVQTTGRLDLARFYTRRLRRLLPALAVVLSVVLVLSTVLGPISGRANTLRTGLWALLLNANNDLAGVLGNDPNDYFNPFSEFDSFLHTWSLSVEEQFYLLFPLLLAATAFAVRGRHPDARARIVGIVLGAVTIASFLGSILLLRLDRDLAFYLSVSRAWEFSIGALLVLVPTDLLSRRGSVRAGVAMTGAVAIGIAVLGFDDLTPFPGTAVLLPVVGTAALIAAGEVGSHPLSGPLAVRPLQWIGDASYSWYLWHWPAIVFAGALWPTHPTLPILAAVLSLLVAWTSLHFVENRFRFEPEPGPPLRFALACVLFPAAAALAASTIHGATNQSPALQEFDSAFAPHVDAALGCAEAEWVGQPGWSQCTWEVPEARGDVLLVGDSTAAHYDRGVISGFGGEGYTVTVATQGSCPFADLTVHVNGEPDRACRDFVVRSMAELRADPPSIVLVSMSNSVYLTEERFALESPGGDRAHSPAAKARVMEAALTRTLSELNAAGSHVVLLHTTPPFDDWFPGACSLVRWERDPSDCAVSRSRPDADADRADALAAERRAVVAAGVTAVDMFDEICAGPTCHTLDESGWRYLDGVHITVDQSARLAPAFAALAP